MCEIRHEKSRQPTPKGDGLPASVCRKSFTFSQTETLSKMEKGASPLFQAFFPLQPRFFLNEAAVFRQSRAGNPRQKAMGCRLYMAA